MSTQSRVRNTPKGYRPKHVRPSRWKSFFLSEPFYAWCIMLGLGIACLCSAQESPGSWAPLGLFVFLAVGLMTMMLALHVLPDDSEETEKTS